MEKHSKDEDLKVLIVEDNTIVAQDLRESLEEMGHTVSGVASTAEGGLRVMEGGEVDLALLDIQLPGKMDGVDLGHRLAREWEIPVLFLTAFSDEETLRRAGATPPLSYLIKPVDDRELRSAIEIARARHAAEMRLRTRNEWYSTVLDAVEVGLLTVDFRGRISEVNAAAEVLLGLRAADAVGRSSEPVLVLRDGMSGDVLDDPVGRALESEEVVPLKGSTVLRRPDGTWLPVSGAASPVRDEDGELVGGVLTLQDARAERKARAAARRSEEHFRTVFRESPLSIHVSTLDEGRILDLNDSFEKELGHPEGEALGRKEEDLGLWIRSEDRADLLRALDEEGRVASFRSAFRTRSGHMLEVALLARRIELEGTPCLLVVTRDVTERVAVEKDLERQALYDTLTALPNRTLLRDRLGHAIDRARREGTGTAVLFIDLDGFKRVNDTYGHAAGDEALRLVARRIRGSFRDEDTLARVGGDEFAAILEDALEPAAAASTARRVLDALVPPFTVHGATIELGASIGIALLEDSGTDAEELLRRSDAAMYRAKSEGGETFRIYESEESSEARDGSRRMQELRRALEEGKFVLRYQPIVELETGVVLGAEALVRMGDPGEGLVHPDRFLSLVEESGETRVLGRQLLETMCRDLGRWTSGPAAAPFVTMNLLPGQFGDPDVVDDIREVVAESASDPSRIVLEITERIAFRSPNTLRELRSLGVKVALDDLGTGLTSFTGLKELSVDLAKVDRSFVQGLGRNHAEGVVVETLLRYAEGMGYEIVAEGIETEDQRRRLLEIGYRMGQGYHLAEPVDAATFGDLVADSGTDLAVS